MHQFKTRQLLAAVQTGITRLSELNLATTESTSDWTRLTASFKELSEHLALGPQPETRVCPTCGMPAMRNATVCGHCWTKTPPPPQPRELR